jgi:hypothetical protein
MTRTKGICLGLAATLGVAVAVARVPGPPDQPPQVQLAVVDQREVIPEAQGVEKITFRHDGLTCTLSIHQGKPGPGQALPDDVQLYCVNPEFSLVPRRPALVGLGPLVHRVERAGAVTQLWFRVRLHSPQLLDAARGKIETSETEKPHLAGNPPRTASVLPWPIYQLAVACRRTGVATPLAISEPKPVKENGNVVEIVLAFDPLRLAEFLEAQERGRLEFIPLYVSRGQRIDVLDDYFTISTEMVARATRTLRAEQQSGEHPIFHNTLQDITSSLSLMSLQDTRVRGKSMLPMVQSHTDLSGAIVARTATLSLQELYKFPEYGAEALAGYLKAQVESVNRSLGYEAITTHAHEQGEQTSDRSGVGFSLGFAARGESQDESFVRNRLEDASGVEFVESAVKRRYVPHRVRVHFLARGSDRQTVTRKRYVQLDAGGLDAPVAPAPVPQWFTTDLVDRQLKELLDRLPPRRSELDRLAELQRDLAKLEAELDGLRVEQDQLAKVKGSLQQQLRDAPKRTTDLTAASARLEEANAQLTAEIKKIRDEHTKLQQAAMALRNQRK